MQERWRMILEFPNYSVSDTGQVRNEDTGRIMTRLTNQRGIPHVGLTRDRILYKRSLTVLVAEAYLQQPDEAFDTPINLDGDRFNNHVNNLMWRPRWFATRYFQQFSYNRVCVNEKIEIIETGEIFENSWHASTSLGVLDSEIAVSIMTRNFVWPLNQHFRRAN